MKILILAFLTLFLVSCSHYGHNSHRGHEEHFKKMDTNSDGKISKAEWDEHFKLMDSNKDQNISTEEMMSFKNHNCTKSCDHSEKSCDYKKKDKK